ncbi:MAG: PqqD family protein [Rhizomicrobium sp.]
MTAMARWKRSDQFVGTQIEDSFVILSIETASYYAFNASANDIWDLLAAPKSTEEIATALTEKYDVAPGDCLRSVERVVMDLSQKGLVSPA